MIRRAELVNFKSHAAPGNVFEFTKGANAVLGPTGAGKTSILQAIGLCVFDFGQPGQFLRKGTKKGEAVVTFVSPVDGKAYTIRRQLGGSKFQLLDEAGAVLAETKEDALRTVREKLGLPPGMDLAQLFEELIGTPQGQLTGALAQGKTDRMKIFNRILRIEEYRTAYEGLYPVEAHSRAQVDEANQRLVMLTTRLEGAETRAQQHQDSVAAIQTAQNQLGDARTAQTSATKTLQDVRAEKKAADAARGDLEEGTKKTMGQHKETEGLQRRVEDATKADQWLRERKDELQRGRTAQEYLDAHQAEYDEHHRLAPQIEEWEGQLGDRRAEVAEWTQRRTEKNQELETAPDFTALARDHGKHQKELQSAQAAHDEASHAVSGSKARVAGLSAAKKNWTALEKLREQARAIPAAFRNGQHRERFATAQLNVERLSTLQQSLDGQFQSLEKKLCPLLDVKCPVPTLDADKSRRAKKRDLTSDLRNAQAGLKALERNASEEERHARVLQSWNDRQADHDEAARVLKELEALETALPKLNAKATQKKDARDAALIVLRQVADQLGRRPYYDGLRKDIATLDRDLKKAATDVDALSERIKTGKQRLAKLAPIAKACETHRGTRSRLATLLEQGAAKTALASELEARTTEWDNAKKMLAALQQEENRLRLHAQNLWTPDHQARLGKAETADRDAGLAVARLANDLKNLRTKSDELRGLVEQDNKNAQAALDTRADLTDLGATHRFIEKTRKILNDAGPIIAKRYVAAISVVANQKYQELTGGQPASLRWTDAYDVEITDSDGETKTFRDLSGGEQVIAALAIRLALLSETSSLSFAFFDEPTIHLDEETRNHVADVLNRTGFDQLVVVSHDDSFSEKIHHAVRLRKIGTRTEQARPFRAPGAPA